MPSVLDLVKHYQHSIEKYPDDEQKVLRAIDKLFQLDVKVQHLQETGVGRTVNALRKESGDVGQAARALVYKWKLMVASEASDHESDNESSIPAGYRYGKDSDDGHQEPSQPENRHMNGDDSAAKRKYQSSEDEAPNRKKSRQSNSSDTEDYNKKRVKEEPQTNSDHSDSHSESSEDSESSEEDIKPVKIKTEPVEIETPKHSYSNHNHDKKESSSSRRSHESEQHSSKYSKHHHSSDKHISEKSSKSSHSSNGKSSRDKDEVKKHREKDDEKEKVKIKVEKEDKEEKARKQEKSRKERKESSQSSDRNSSEKHRSSSSHKDSSSDKHKSPEKNKSDHEKQKSDKHRSKSDRDKQKSSEKDSANKHKPKDSSSKEKSSSSKEKSKDKSSSSKEKEKSSSHSSKSDKEHSDKSKSEHKSKSSDERTNEKSEKKSSHKSSSSDKNKTSSSKSKDKPKKKVTVQETTEDSDDGIGCESGASFAEALGMVVPTKTKKKQSSTPVKDAHSPSNPVSSDLSPAALLAPTAKLAPLPAIEISALPEISPHYKPRPPPKFQPHFNDEDAMNMTISSKNARTKVFSGTRTFGKIPSLYEMCVYILQEHIDALEYTGGVPYEILKPVVDRASPQQLFNLEHYNPYLMEDTDHLWQKFCEKHFRCKKRQEFESWREMYMRCQEEQEQKLKSLTANIRMTQEAKKAPIKQTKMAYVDSVVKPPRNIAKKQAQHGTAHMATASPAARVAALAAAPNVLKGGVRAPPAVPVSSSTFNKPKKAPLMQKALQLLRGRKR